MSYGFNNSYQYGLYWLKDMLAYLVPVKPQQFASAF